MFFIPGLRKGVSVVGIIAAIGIPWLVTNIPNLVFDKPAEIVDVPIHMRACRSHDDCGFVETACSSCCRYAPINKKQIESFRLQEYGPVCADYKGAVCDCVPAADLETLCIKGKCTQVNKTNYEFNR